MATYKVLQDIEAEDKLFGPFTLKQFVFAGITIVIGFIAFRILLAGLPLYVTLPIISIVLLPPFLLFGFLAAPIGRDQTSETWLIARLRFLFKPRVRIWSQDGIKELVTITVPKQIEHIYTKDFTQDEVRSRLKALANTVDSRGWAVKNVNANLFNQPGYIQNNAPGSDRLIDPSNIPQEVPTIEVLPSDDILDPQNNSTAQHFDQLIQQSSSQHRQEVIASMQVAATNQQTTGQTQPPTDYYFMHENNVSAVSAPQDYSTFRAQNVVLPGSNDAAVQSVETPEEIEFAKKQAERNREQKDFMTNHGLVLQPIHDKEGNIIRQPEPIKEAEKTKDTIQNQTDPGIIELAYRSDLYIDTTARQAKKIQESKKSDSDEVVISLHQ